MPYRIKPCHSISGKLQLLGDKSISHRALIVSSLACGKTTIDNISVSDDCQVTFQALRNVGVRIDKKAPSRFVVHGVGRFGFSVPQSPLQMKESGTSMRMLLGLFSAQPFASRLIAAPSLNKRPMRRVIEPLRKMGAAIKASRKKNDEFPPISIFPAELGAINWKMKVPSAQVKSAILLAGLYASEKTVVYESIPTRDHTEKMLRFFKAPIRIHGKNITIRSGDLISPGNIVVPADISSAAFFIVLACLLPHSRITIKNVCLNPTRSGILEVLKAMGAHLIVRKNSSNRCEPAGDIIVSSSCLKGVRIRQAMIPRLIDELPILMVAASLAKGRSVFEGVGELRLKEADRIKSMVTNLSRMGIAIESKIISNKEVIVIEGSPVLHGAYLKSFGDHRTVMSMAIAALCADSPSTIDSVGSVSKSFPSFFLVLKHLVAK